MFSWGRLTLQKAGDDGDGDDGDDYDDEVVDVFVDYDL